VKDKNRNRFLDQILPLLSALSFLDAQFKTLNYSMWLVNKRKNLTILSVIYSHQNSFWLVTMAGWQF